MTAGIKSTLVRWLTGIIVLGAAIFAATLLTEGKGGSKSGTEKWTFLDDKALDELGLVAQGTESAGAWALEPHDEATGGRALANSEGDGGSGPALLIAKSPKARDLKTHTRCKVVSVSAPEAKAACGVVFRYVDDANHWIVRANASAGVIEAVSVVGRKETVVRSAPDPSAALGSWADLFVEVRGDTVTVSIDKRKLFVAEAPTIPAAYASAGLWATSESKVYFDHFSIETLTATPQAIEVLPILGNKRSGALTHTPHSTGK